MEYIICIKAKDNFYSQEFYDVNIDLKYYYYTTKTGHALNLTINIIYANKYKNIAIAKAIITRQKLLEKYTNINGFVSLTIIKGQY